MLVAVAIVASGLGLAAPPAGAAPGLTVTPATGLLDQQIVTVTGTGFAPGARVLLTQCAGAAPAGCALDPPSNRNGAVATADAHGNVRAGLRLPRVLALASGAVSCAGDTCAIVALSWDDGGATEWARTPIAFAATGSTPRPPDAGLSVALADMRANGGRGTFAGAGYLPWFRASFLAFDEPVPLRYLDQVSLTDDDAYLALCRRPPAGWAGCERFVSPPVPLGSSGTFFQFTETVEVRPDGTLAATVREVPRMWTTEDGRVDCAVEDCSIALEQDEWPRSEIADVAWAKEWAPWSSASAFVADAYPALLGRRATASERSAAAAGLADRSLTGFDLLLQLAGRSEARPLAEITRLYLAALGRRPDGPGLLHWERELRRTGSMAAIASAFGRSPEFRQVFGSVSDAQAVTLAYERTLGRTPATSERDYWVGRLRAGLSRTHMVHLFSRTPEFLAREAGRSQATAVVVALLGRGPTADEWSLMGPGWSHRDLRTQDQRIDDVVLAVLSSDALMAEVG